MSSPRKRFKAGTWKKDDSKTFNYIIKYGIDDNFCDWSLYDDMQKEGEFTVDCSWEVTSQIFYELKSLLVQSSEF